MNDPQIGSQPHGRALPLRVRDQVARLAFQSWLIEGIKFVDELPRRKMLRRGLQLLSAATVLPLVATRARAQALACVEPASESVRGLVNYKDPSPNPAQACMACGFFMPEKDPCGHCQILVGTVNSKAHCDSWSAKS